MPKTSRTLVRTTRQDGIFKALGQLERDGTKFVLLTFTDRETSAYCSPGQEDLAGRFLKSNEDEDNHLYQDDSPFVEAAKSSVLKNTPIVPLHLSSEEYTVLNLINSNKTSEYLLDAISTLQQLNCKFLCKTWIKAIEPRKQTNFPYKYGESRRPRWWPINVRHKEPDHLMKPERVQLLLAIMRSVDLCVLKESTAEVKGQLHQDKLGFLDEIFYVVWMERLAQKGLLGNKPYLYVSMSYECHDYGKWPIYSRDEVCTSNSYELSDRRHMLKVASPGQLDQQSTVSSLDTNAETSLAGDGHTDLTDYGSETSAEEDADSVFAVAMSRALDGHQMFERQKSASYDTRDYKHFAGQEDISFIDQSSPKRRRFAPDNEPHSTPLEEIKIEQEQYEWPSMGPMTARRRPTTAETPSFWYKNGELL